MSCPRLVLLFSFNVFSANYLIFFIFIVTFSFPVLLDVLYTRVCVCVCAQGGNQGLTVVIQGQGQTQGQLQLIPAGVTVIPGPGQQLMQAAMPSGQVQRFLFTPMPPTAAPAPTTSATAAPATSTSVAPPTSTATLPGEHSHSGPQEWLEIIYGFLFTSSALLSLFIMFLFGYSLFISMEIGHMFSYFTIYR